MTSNQETDALRTTARLVATIALVSTCAFASCLLAGYDKAEDGAGGAGGGSSTSIGIASASSTTSGSGSAGGDELPLCETTEYPDGPTDALPGDGTTKWFALRSIVLGDPDEPSSVPGFDLDRVETCNEECRGIDPECSRPDFLGDLSPTQEQERCDWPKAVDNTTVYLFESAAVTLGVTDVDLSEQADAGTWSLLLRVSDWNGTANDAEVTVALYSTIGWQPGEGGGTSSSASSGAGGGGGAGPVGPAWDGTDTWSIDSRSLVDPGNVDTPSFKTETGYISGGTLVAELGGLFYAGTTRLPIRIATGRLVAPMNLTIPSRPKLAGATFAGRWPVADLIPALGGLLIGTTPFCEQTLVFNGVIERACRLVDVTTTAGLGTCSALSFGIRFDSETVLPGTIVEPADPPSACPPLTCETLLAEP